jgi:hypothetical protein
VRANFVTASTRLRRGARGEEAVSWTREESTLTD